VQGSPFLKITEDDEKSLDKIYAARNAIAHGSNYALKIFFDKYQAIPNDRSHSPVKLLLKYHDTEANKTHIDFMHDSILFCASKLAT
jgi:hypothetical protein